MVWPRKNPNKTTQKRATFAGQLYHPDVTSEKALVERQKKRMDELISKLTELESNENISKDNLNKIEDMISKLNYGKATIDSKNCQEAVWAQLIENATKLTLLEISKGQEK
ncbi:MAG: hypothetical protein IJV31_08360 [Clostridia bacterium]|nr:hypothetical protein [Clostridia bacterium]